MNEQHDMVKVSYGVISGMIACILTLTYSFYSLCLRPDSGLGVRTLGNIKFYVMLGIIWTAMRCHRRPNFNNAMVRNRRFKNLISDRMKH